MSVIATTQEARDINHTTEIAYERERTNHMQFKQLNTRIKIIIIIYNYYCKIFKNGKNKAF
jgi:hypothetical protein